MISTASAMTARPCQGWPTLVSDGVDTDDQPEERGTDRHCSRQIEDPTCIGVAVLVQPGYLSVNQLRLRG